MGNVEEGWEDNPHWQEMSERLDEIEEEIEEGFGVEFEISVYDAKQLIEVYDRATDGDRAAIMLVMLEFGKLVNQLREYLDETGF
jgi:hemerythrin-like domain-containing protein